MSNRERILTTALSLFNEKGTAAVSTNHIADAAAVSPGNLYFHFKNKEDIIRALYERLFAAWDESLRLPGDRAPSLDDLEALIAENFRLIYAYRFAYREMAILLHNDAELQQKYLRVRRRGYTEFGELIEAFVAFGVLTPQAADPGELAKLTELIWIISEQWPVNLELSGRAVDEAGIREGVELMRYTLRPYLIGR